MNAFHQTIWNAFVPSSFSFFALDSELTSAIFFYLCKTHAISTKFCLGVLSTPGKSVYMGQLSTRLAKIPALFAEISARRVTRLSHINSEPAKYSNNIATGISPLPSNLASTCQYHDCLSVFTTKIKEPWRATHCCQKRQQIKSLKYKII